MSEARNQRFEIDIDEIERQLRRSVEQPAPSKPDPLAELARIVGQDDPFRGILASPPGSRAGPAANANAVAEAPPVETVHLTDPPPPPETYDPVSEAYGSHQDSLSEETYKPLRRRGSRGKLVAVMGALVLTVGAVAAGLTLRKPGGFLSSEGPPVIVADKSPLKVQPENPGGMEVPNQDRQIYSKGNTDGQSKVIDGREQPVDVRAATSTLQSRTPLPSTPQQAPSPAVPERSAVSDALGEPRRVRTVAVNPDGTSYGKVANASTPAANTQAVIPTGELPPPVTVQTVAVPNGRPAAPVMADRAAPPAADLSNVQAVSVLPPARPNLEGRSAPAAEAPSRTASLPPADAKPAAKPKPAATPISAAKPEAAAEKPAAGAKTYAVQIAVRPSEQEARAAWDQAQEKFGSTLENKPARLTNATVNGKTVHRVRLGPMTKAEADAMCGRLKSRGGNCFVAQN